MSVPTAVSENWKGCPTDTCRFAGWVTIAGGTEPDTQAPCALQTSPAPHEEPAGLGVCVTPFVALQVSVVHGLPSSTLTGVPGVQLADAQDSSPLQLLASEQGVVTG